MSKHTIQSHLVDEHETLSGNLTSQPQASSAAEDYVALVVVGLGSLAIVRVGSGWYYDGPHTMWLRY